MDALTLLQGGLANSADEAGKLWLRPMVPGLMEIHCRIP